jgi:NTE family protein
MSLGIAFSGGGVRGASHLGIVQALYESGINPLFFTGTSSGSLVAMMLANGVEPEKAFELYKEASKEGLVDIAYFHILSSLILRKPIEGLLEGKKLDKIINKLLGNKTLGSVPKQIGIVTTEISTGKQVIFSNQSYHIPILINDDNYAWVSRRGIKLADIAKASCSLPAIFRPFEFNGKGLVDGGLVNNLPIDVAFALGAKQVISIDLGYSGKAEKVVGLGDTIIQSIAISMERVTDNHRLELSPLYLNPEVYDVRPLDSSRLDECWNKGYSYGKLKAREILYNIN